MKVIHRTFYWCPFSCGKTVTLHSRDRRVSVWKCRTCLQEFEKEDLMVINNMRETK